MERALAECCIREHPISHGNSTGGKDFRERKRTAFISAMNVKYAAARLHEQKLNIKRSYSASPCLSFSTSAGKSAREFRLQRRIAARIVEIYEIEVVVAQANVTDLGNGNFAQLRTLDVLSPTLTLLHRVLYPLGNSTFHEHMFGLLKVVPVLLISLPRLFFFLAYLSI